MAVIVVTNLPRNASAADQVQAAIAALQECTAELACRTLDEATLGQQLLEQARTVVPQWLPFDEVRVGSLWAGRADSTNPSMFSADRVTVCLNTGSWLGASGERGENLVSLWSYLRGGISMDQAARELVHALHKCEPAGTSAQPAALCPARKPYVYDWAELRSLSPGKGQPAAPQGSDQAPVYGALVAKHKQVLAARAAVDAARALNPEGLE